MSSRTKVRVSYDADGSYDTHGTKVNEYGIPISCSIRPFCVY